MPSEISVDNIAMICKFIIAEPDFKTVSLNYNGISFCFETFGNLDFCDFLPKKLYNIDFWIVSLNPLGYKG